MIALVQRVSRAKVVIDGETQGEIGRGLVILLGVQVGDTQADGTYLAEKCAGLRIFEDENGKMNLSPADIGGELLIVTNFTLCGDCAKGRRPSFERAERPDKAQPLSEVFIQACRKTGLPVATGRFGADMQLSLTNDGPVTLILDTRQMRTQQK